MKEYVCGFVFDDSKRRVAVIRKIKPDWQNGKLNGIGGKIEDTDATPHLAMKREFEEEAGIEIPPYFWKRVCILTDCRGWKVHFFKAFIPNSFFNTILTKQKEIVEFHLWDVLVQREDIISNLRWLIPFCLDEYLKGDIEIVEETPDKP